jgi:integrase
MPHYPHPYYREKRGTWYVQINQREYTLGRDKDEAFRLYHELMGRKPQRAAPPPTGSPMVAVVEIVDAFLEWAFKNRNKLTYEAYKRRLQAFVDAIPPTLSHTELKPHHVTRVMDANAEKWNSNTKHDFATAVQRVFNWAQSEGYITHNPLAKVRKPGREARELAIGPADYAEVMAAVKEPNFRQLLAFAWESGVRPQEIRAIEARHVDFEQKRIVFPPRESKGKKGHRIVYLSEMGIEILKPLVEKNSTGALFRNSEGAAWNKNSINCAFCRLRKKIGRKLHLGAWRKGYATEALKAGIDVIGVATLLGHSNSVMLAKVYAKLQQDPEYMAGQANKAKRPRKD